MRRVLAWIGTVVFLLLVVVAFALLVVTQSDYGRAKIRSYVLSTLQSKMPGGIVRMGRVTGNALTGLTVADFSITDSAGAPFFTADSLTTQIGLAELAHRQIVLRHVRLVHPLLVFDKLPGHKWNYQYINADTLPSPPGKPPSSLRLEFDDVTTIGGEFILRSPWHPNDTLSVAQKDSAVRLALAGGKRYDIQTVPGGWQKITRMHHIDANLPELVLHAPNTHVKWITVARVSMIAAPFLPPVADVRNLKGKFLYNSDSLWFANADARTPASHVVASGRFIFDNNAFRLVAHADTVHGADFQWAYPRLPSDFDGHTTMALTWNDQADSYEFRNTDARTAGSHMTGSLGFSFPNDNNLTYFHHTDLRGERVDTRTLEQLIANWHAPRRGKVSGHLVMLGSLSRALQLNTDATFDDITAGRSHVIAQGVVAYDHAVVRTENFHMTMLPLQLAIVQAMKPGFPIGGTLTGTATMNGATNTAFDVHGEVTHTEFGAVSRLGGHAYVEMTGAKRVNVDAQLHPLALELVGHFVPKLGLHGSAYGPLKLNGPMSHMTIDTRLAVEHGGNIDVTGFVGMGGAQPTYAIDTRMHLFDAHAVIAKAPATSLTAVASVRGSGTTPATMHADIAADVRASAWQNIPLDTAHIRVSIGDGMLHVASLRVGGRGTLVEAAGDFGLAAGKNGQLTYHVAIDTLSGVRAINAPRDTSVVLLRPRRRAFALARARADSAKLAKATEVERAVTGAPAPKLASVDTTPAIPKDSLSGSLIAAGTVTGNLTRFDLRGRMGADSLVAYGQKVKTMRAEYAWLNARTPQASVVLAARGEGMAVYGFDLDSVDVRLAYRMTEETGNIVLVINQEEGTTYGVNGDFALHLEHKELHLAGVTMQFDTTKWAMTHPAALRWGASGIEIVNFEMRSGGLGRIYVNGSIPKQGDANLDVAVENFRVDNFLSLIESAVPLTGYGSFAGHLQGTLSAPRFAGALGLVDATYGGTPIPELHGTLKYADRMMHFTANASRTGGEPVLVAKGDIPIYLGTDTVASRFGSTGFAVDVSADSLPLDALPHFTELVADVHGRAIGSLKLRGTFAHPIMVGALYLDLGSSRIVPNGMRVHDLTGFVRIDRDTLVVDSLVGYAGGPIRVTGGMGVRNLLQPSFDLRMVAVNARVLDNDKGHLRADAAVTLNGSFASPVLAGHALVRGGVIYVPESDHKHVVSSTDPAIFNVVDTSLAENRALLPASSPFMRNLRMDLTIGIARNTWVRSSTANVELYTDAVTGDLAVHMDRAHDALVLDGVLSTERGEYEFLSKKFRITQGSATFIGTQEVNPILQITGEYQVQLPAREALNIQVVIGGTLNTPTLSLTSDASPPISQSDLLSYLAFGKSSSSLLQTEGSGLSSGGSSGALVGTGAALAGRRLASVALGVAIQDLQGQAGRSIGADVFDITPADVYTELAQNKNLGGFVQGTQVEAGKYTDPSTYVAIQARPTLALPGLLYQRRLPNHYRLEASAEPRFLLTTPTLEPQPAVQTNVVGVFLIREWRF